MLRTAKLCTSYGFTKGVSVDVSCLLINDFLEYKPPYVMPYLHIQCKVPSSYFTFMMAGLVTQRLSCFFLNQLKQFWS